MTRVRLGRLLLEYRQCMAEWVDELRSEKTGSGAKPPVPKAPWQASWQPKDRSALASMKAGLLAAPAILLLDVSAYDGQASDFIQIATCDEFGVDAVHVSICDEHGNLIEDDYALENPDFTDHWVYFANVPVPAGTRVTISARAMDALGAVGIKTCQRTTP
jgi:hypothetical protein